MKVANRLRGALALYVLSLVALATLYARTADRAADESRVLAELATDVRQSTDQLARIDQLSGDAEKYLATRDVRYREKFAEGFRVFGSFHPRAMQPQFLDSIRAEVQQAGAASQEAMRLQIMASERAAKRAARVAWMAVTVALGFGIALSTILVRSIVRPLDRLAIGTRAIAAGNFQTRLDAKASDEFSVVARDFNVMSERLGELDRMKKDFVAKISHDLKTPLSSMQETNRALVEEVAGPLSPTQRRLLELNLESGQRLSAMLGKLLDLSRLEAGVVPGRSEVDVGRVAKRIAESANANAARRGVKLSVSAAEPSPILADPNGISQIVDNLVENAIKFSPPQSEVRISVENSRDDEVQLTVADEGPGIAASDKARVFDRFYQADAGRAVSGRGVGLGLTICREIVSAHGGRIWVDDNSPRGSTFKVILRRGAATAAGLLLAGVVGCAPLHRAEATPRPEDLQLRIASLTAEVDAVRARLDSTSAAADSLRLELERLKAIDLRPRTPPRRPPTR